MFLKLFEQGLEGGGHARDLGEAGEGGNPVDRMDPAIDFEKLFESRRFRVGLVENLQDGAQIRERGGQVGNEGFPEVGLKVGLGLGAARGLVENGEPAGARDGGGARERALYLKGASLWHQGDRAGAREHFFELLALPEAERRVFTLPAEFNLARSEEPEEARRHFATLRAQIDDGWEDVFGLAVASLGEEARLALEEGDDARAVALYATQASHGSPSGVLSLLFVARQLVSDEARLDRALGDPLVQRLIATYLWTRSVESWWSEGSPSHSASELLERLAGLPNVAGGDRLAAALFRAGRFEEAQRLVEREDSAIAHWVKAKLFLRRGQREAADRELERAAEGYPLSELWTFEYSPEYVPRQQIELERSIIALSHDDFDAAMRHAMAGCSWEDVAYLAERVLDVEALKRLVDVNPSPLDACAGLASSTWLATSQPMALRAILARRLLRVEREREALRYFEGETKALAEKYVVALEAARAERAPLVRAAHWYEAAKVAREHGMELLGFEGPPDLRWTGGNYFWAEPSLDGGQSTEEARRCVASAPKFPVRFHYREIASRLAEQAASAVSPRSQAFTALLCKAASYVKWGDPAREAELWRRAVNEGPLLKEPMNFGSECPEPRFVPPPEHHRPFHVRKRSLALGGLAVLGLVAVGVLVARRRARRP